MSATQNTFVVISDDPELIETVRTSVASRALIQVARDVPSALRRVTSSPTVGAVVDGKTLHGSAAGQLAWLRASSPLVNVLFIPSDLHAGLLNDVQPLRVELLARPLPLDAVERFVLRTWAAGRLSDLQMGAWIERLAREHKLSGSEIALFPLVLERETPEALCARLNIDQAALSRSLRRLVKKCRVRNTDRLAKNVMRDALLFSSHPSEGYVRCSAHA